MAAHLAQQRASRLTAVVGVVVNLILTISKVIAGIMSGSTALLADALHSLSDMLTDGMTYFLLKVSHTAADENHPYGHGKFETIGTLALAALLMGISVGVLWQVGEHALYGRGPVVMPYLAAGVALFSIIANEALFRYAVKVGEVANSQLVIANAWHHRSDSLSSLAALLGIIGGYLLNWPYFDDIAALAVAYMLAKVAWDFGKQAFDELVDSALSNEKQQEIEKIILGCSGVLGCHQLRGRTIGGRMFIDVHVEVDPFISVSEGHAIAEQVEQNLFQQLTFLEDVTVHIDPQRAAHKPIPEQAMRDNLTETIRNTITDMNLPACALHTLHVHYLEHHYSADVVLIGISMEEAASLHKRLNKGLLKPHGKLHSLSVLLRL